MKVRQNIFVLTLIAVFIFSFQLYAQPNLTKADLTFNPVGVVTGGTVYLSGSVINNGNASTGASFKVNFHLSGSSSVIDYSKFLHHIIVPTLSPGENYPFDNEPATVSTTIPLGSYYIWMSIDVDDHISESNEYDNQSPTTSSQLEILPPAPLPQPNLTSVWLTFNPTSAVAGAIDAVNLSGSIINNGTAPTNANFQLSFYLSQNPNVINHSLKFYEFTKSALNAGQSDDFNKQATIPSTIPPGFYYVWVIIDLSNSITESNEFDNQARTSSQLQVLPPQPNLTTAWLIFSPLGVVAGAVDAINLSGAITNNGAAPTNTGFQVSFSLSQDPNVINHSLKFYEFTMSALINANQSDNFNEQATIPATIPPGFYYVWISIDVSNSIVESSELDNQYRAISQLQVLPVPQPVMPPDLVINSIGILPVVGGGGTTTTVNFNLMNQGSSPTSKTFLLSIYFSLDVVIGPGDTQLLLITENAPIGAGASKNYSKQVSIPGASAGLFYLGVYADAGNLIAESNENNNTAYTSFIHTNVKKAEIGIIPSDFKLDDNYPNPFNPTTTINYQLPKSAEVSLKIYNSSGQEIATLVESYKSAGYYSATWDATGASSGIYFYILQAGNYKQAKRMLLMR